MFDCDENNLKILPSEVSDRVGVEVTVTSDKIMICSTTMPSTSNTPENLLLNTNYHFPYINKEFKEKKETNNQHL